MESRRRTHASHCNRVRNRMLQYITYRLPARVRSAPSIKTGRLSLHMCRRLFQSEAAPFTPQSWNSLSPKGRICTIKCLRVNIQQYNSATTGALQNCGQLRKWCRCSVNPKLSPNNPQRCNNRSFFCPITSW